MHNGCQQAAKRNRKWPRQKLLPSSTVSNKEWHMTSIPCAPWRIGRYCGQAGRGPPRSHCMHQDTDGLLQDDQWWASWAWTALLYHLCIPPWGKAPRKTYGQAIQDTLQWAGWHCCEPLHHPTCQGTSLPQHQTCGHNLPGQRVDSPHQPQQPWPHTICTLQGLSPTAPNSTSWQGKLPSMWFPLFQMQQNGHWGPKCHGGKPLNQGMHLHLVHCRGSPDAHLGTTTTAKGGTTKQTP